MSQNMIAKIIPPPGPDEDYDSAAGLRRIRHNLEVTLKASRMAELEAKLDHLATLIRTSQAVCTATIEDDFTFETWCTHADKITEMVRELNPPHAWLSQHLKSIPIYDNDVTHYEDTGMWVEELFRDAGVDLGEEWRVAQWSKEARRKRASIGLYTGADGDL
tara:strand:+ start:6138 stop:6623 length:486 start_codon:yes stop_codon:yes gene_type:complete